MKMKLTLALVLPIFANNGFGVTVDSVQNIQATYEELIVTARHRKENLQDIPMAVSILTGDQLQTLGVKSLSDIKTISSLNILPYSNDSLTLAPAIRGAGTGDVGLDREPTVAIYLDGIYLGRAQGTDFEIGELARIEILRGPQGALYGRNATAGAINLLSKAPMGEFNIRQSIATGSYDLITGNTHIDLPAISGISTKLDYMYSKRDGWVKNADKDEHDYNAYEKEGFGFTAEYSESEKLIATYRFNKSNISSTQLYYQFYEDLFGYFGEEGGRQTHTRADIQLDPSTTEQQLHSLNLTWALSDNLNLQSLTSHRELDSKIRNNYAGTAYFNGLIEAIDLNYEQVSQEFRLISEGDRIDWTIGLHQYKETSAETLQQYFSLDIFGGINGTELSPINPPTTFDALIREDNVAPSILDTETEATAFYAHTIWTPPILNDNLSITLGARHTKEDKSGNRFTNGKEPFSISTGDNTDKSVSVDYRWTDTLLSYAKWSTAHRSGSVNLRSEFLLPYEKEEVEAYEIGLKSDSWDGRLHINIAAFTTEYDGMFIDVFHPTDFTIADTINAQNPVDVTGFELESVIRPTNNLSLALSYTYLDGEIDPQINPLSELEETFLLTQTPRHAGSISIDYEFPPLALGTFTGHIDIVSSTQQHHWPSGGIAHPDGYTLYNARLSLINIPVVGKSNIVVSLWGKNLTDEEYIVSSFNFEATAKIHAFGDPRTVGIELKYNL